MKNLIRQNNSKTRAELVNQELVETKITIIGTE